MDRRPVALPLILDNIQGHFIFAILRLIRGIYTTMKLSEMKRSPEFRLFVATMSQAFLESSESDETVSDV